MGERIMSSCAWATIAVLCLGLPAVVESADLYRVSVRSQEDAERLTDLQVDAVLRVFHGYLVLLDPGLQQSLKAGGFHPQFIASVISRDDLAIDMRRDDLNKSRFRVLFEEGTLRLLEVDEVPDSETGTWLGLAPIPKQSLPIVYRERTRIDLARARDMLDLDSLIGSVRADSCHSYVIRLQEFGTRLIGTDSNLASMDWLVAKFQEFGYDSIYSDTFPAPCGWLCEEDTVDAHNVIATKVGSLYPEHHIVIGAHRDSAPLESPGADDNGSGTGGVLELARILADVDNRLTLVFIAFDAEEAGLWGAKYYAGEAAQRGDSIALMINMDMIGFMENDTNACIYHTDPGSYGPLWAELADSPTGININGRLVPGAGWDAEPFEQQGYEALTVHEYEFQTNIHTAHDSAVYIDFDYMKRMLQATLVTAYVADNVHEIAPLQFSVPGGVPDVLMAGLTNTIELQINVYGPGSIVPGSVWMHFAIGGGPMDSLNMTATERGLHTVKMPPVYTISSISLDFSAEDASTGVWYHPDTSHPFERFFATEFEEAFADNFETDLGWTVMGGLVRGNWERAIPEPAGFWGAPPYDYDGSGYCYVTDNRSIINVDDCTTRLVSPETDVAGKHTIVHYARWYSNSYPSGEPNADTFRVYIRELGTSFSLLEIVGPVEESDGGWYEKDFWINELFHPDNPIQLRFDASDNGELSTMEAGVDDVRVTVYTCAPLILTETLPDWTAGVAYNESLIAGSCCSLLTWTDKYDNLSGSGLALSSDGIVVGTPMSPATLTFTGVATDDSTRTDEKQVSFTINPAVSITSDSLPDGQAEVAYSYQLQASGGTGTLAWSDKFNDLAGTGLTLAADGLLTGTPLDSGTVGFTADATDEVGSVDERQLTLGIEVFYICGNIDDITGPGGPVDVADLSYLVDFLFRGGPDPACE